VAIDRLELENFLVFQGEFSLALSPGVNIFIGGNGTGKTTLLKAMYAICENSSSTYDVDQWQDIGDCFLMALGHGSEFIHQYLHGDDATNDHWKCHLFYNGEEFGFSQEDYISDPGPADLLTRSSGDPESETNTPYIKAVFIPTTEMLSHSKGFMALSYQRALAFDKTQIDIVAKAETPETRKITPSTKKLLDKTASVIDGEVLYEGDEFFVKKKNGLKIPFFLEADGFRKFGLLWKLLRNGFLESGSILFWDEPEANINAELFPELVEILLELQRSGVQIFLATHNYYLARYFDVRKDKRTCVMFHNLTKKDGNTIESSSSPEYLKLANNLLEKASADMFDAVVDSAMMVEEDE
jgi:energy-coupling factor transporter ATP-binding protein EcfA2